MKNIRISTQLFCLVFGLIAAFGFVQFMQNTASSQNLRQERYQLLQSQVESATSILSRYHSLAEAGEMTEEDAKAEAFKVITDIRFEPDGYFFGFNSDTIMIIHPKTSLLGKSFKGMTDKNDFPFADNMVANALDGGGVTSYHWPKLGEDENNIFPKAAYTQMFKPWGVILGTGVYVDDLNAQIHSNQLSSIIGGLVVLLLGTAAAYFIIQGIIKPLKNVHNAMTEIAEENIEIEVPHTAMRNEIGMMAQATQILKEKVIERQALTATKVQQDEQINSEREQNSQAARRETERQARVVKLIGAALEKLADGDLSSRCPELGGEYESLRANFNNAMKKLEAAMVKMSHKGGDLEATFTSISQASTDMSRRTEGQAANLEETSAALTELTEAVNSAAEDARNVANRVNDVSNDAERSDSIVDEAIVAMSGIEESSNKISKVISVIDEIAFQTNLLALNAGVEAAPARESGRGFAVVAQEVRELAQRSADAAKEIKDQIQHSTSQVEQGVNLVGQTGEALKRIAKQIKEANQLVSQISVSSSEQSTTLHSITSSVHDMDAGTQKNAAMAEQITAATNGLVEDTNELLMMIQGFKLSVDNASQTESDDQPYAVAS